MKITTCLSIVLISAGSLGSCKKNDEVSTENKQKADEFKAAIVSQQFQVRDYYSDKPID
jgi:hypothetical protein